MKLIFKIIIFCASLNIISVQADEDASTLPDLNKVKINIANFTNIKPDPSLGRIFSGHIAKSIKVAAKEDFLAILNKTIQVVTKNSDKSKELDFYFVMRRFYQYTASTTSSATSSVSWAVKDKETGSIIFAEDFYVQHNGVLITSPKIMRNENFKKTIRRILTTISKLEKNKFNAADITPVQDGTFKTYKDFDKLKWKTEKWVRTDDAFDWDTHLSNLNIK